MAERRTARGGAGGRTSTSSRQAADRDEQEILDDRETLEEEPEAREEDKYLDADELEAADEDETLDVDEPEAADEDRSAGNGEQRSARRSRPAMTAAEAAKAALHQITALTAKQPEGVTEVERTDDGWTVGIEIVEDQRIPSSADILATYETTIDADGELLSYRRVRRYARGRGDTEDV